MKRSAFLIALVLLIATTPAYSQKRSLYIGDIELRLGMSREDVMKSLTGKSYLVSVFGDTGFLIRKYDEPTKQFSVLGNIAFDDNQLSYINRTVDTTGWPDDEGYAVARAIYDAIHSSIPLTDSDGAKRANARITVASQDTGKPTRGTIRSIDVYINDQRISVAIWEKADGRSVDASVSIRSKPW